MIDTSHCITSLLMVNNISVKLLLLTSTARDLWAVGGDMKNTYFSLFVVKSTGSGLVQIQRTRWDKNPNSKVNHDHSTKYLFNFFYVFGVTK